MQDENEKTPTEEKVENTENTNPPPVPTEEEEKGNDTIQNNISEENPAPPELNETEKESKEEETPGNNVPAEETEKEKEEEAPVEEKNEAIETEVNAVDRPKPGDENYTEAHRLEDEAAETLRKEGIAARDYTLHKKQEDPKWDSLSLDVRQLYIDKVK